MNMVGIFVSDSALMAKLLINMFLILMISHALMVDHTNNS